jgi:hypothetical protein
MYVDQYYGVNAWARDLLSNTVEVEEKGERIYPTKFASWAQPSSLLIRLFNHVLRTVNGLTKQ